MIDHAAIAEHAARVEATRLKVQRFLEDVNDFRVFVAAASARHLHAWDDDRLSTRIPSRSPGRVPRRTPPGRRSAAAARPSAIVPPSVPAGQVDIGSVASVREWCAKFAIDEPALREAFGMVGPMPQAIEFYLKSKTESPRSHLARLRAAKTKARKLAAAESLAPTSTAVPD